MPRFAKGPAAHYPHLSDWFEDALEKLNSSDPLLVCADENDGPPLAGTKWLANRQQLDLQSADALIRLCAALPKGREALVDLLCDPFQVTIVETHDEALIAPVEDALEGGLLPAIRRTYDHIPKVKLLSPASCSYASNPKNRRAEFEKSLQEGLSDDRPQICIVETISQVSAPSQRAATHVISLPALSRQMVLKLFSVIHGPLDPVSLSDVYPLLPCDTDLALLDPQDITIAVRKATCQEMAATLGEQVPDRQPSAKAGALNDVKGLGPSKATLEQLASDLKSWKRGALDWAEIPRGLLLFGPPGTGKTYTAGKLAEEIGAHFIATSYGDWQKAGHLGDFLAAMHRSFKDAKDRAPSLLFIDEIDSFGDRATASGDNAGYVRNAVNGLLEQLDGSKGCEGVLVVAACNDAEALDAALIRSGRFDMKLPMPVPDKSALAEMLQFHAGAEIPSSDLDSVAAHLVGCSGADVAAVVRQARGLARQHRRGLAGGDLWTAAKFMVPAATLTDLKRAAIHEAGHAVVGYVSGKGVPASAEIRAQGGAVQFRPGTRYSTNRELEIDLVCCLAGRAAEQVFFSDVSAGAGGGAQSDLALATRLSAQIELQFGLGDLGLVWRDVTDKTLPRLLEDPNLKDRISIRLDAAYDIALRRVSDHRQLVQAVADQLLSRRQLTCEELSALLSPQAEDAPAHRGHAARPKSVVARPDRVAPMEQ